MGVYIGANAPKTCCYGKKAVQKIYLGDVLLWPTAKELKYFGTVTPLSEARYQLAATSTEGHALFAGGRINSTVVDAYDAGLTRTTPTPMSSKRYDLAAAAAGSYALFGGGYLGSGTNYTVDAYDASLTRTTVPTKLGYARACFAATAFYEYAIFGGGKAYGAAAKEYNALDVYDASLIRRETVDFLTSPGRHNLAAAATEHYAMFGGGRSDGRYVTETRIYATVDAYNTDLTHTTAAGLSLARELLAAASVGSYILFAGGGRSAIVDAYDASLTRTTPAELSVARNNMAAVSMGGYALFFGGDIGNTSFSDRVDAYDASLTRTTPTTLSLGRYIAAAVTVGNYALFGGGMYMHYYDETTGSGKPTDVVDVYTLG